MGRTSTIADRETSTHCAGAAAPAQCVEVSRSAIVDVRPIERDYGLGPLQKNAAIDACLPHVVQRTQQKTEIEPASDIELHLLSFLRLIPFRSGAHAIGSRREQRQEVVTVW